MQRRHGCRDRPLSRVSVRPNRTNAHRIAGGTRRGTTPEEQHRGLATAFDSADTAGVAAEAIVATDGTARIQFHRSGEPWALDTGRWTSDQLNSLLDPLLATVFSAE